MGSPTTDTHNLPNIILIGMPAVGKTYWGARIADHYALPFIDLDNYIEQAEGISVPQIFVTYGESKFRELETTYLNHFLKAKSDTMVLACGGGTPCFGNNMALLRELGIVIYLQSDTHTLIEHIEKDNKDRPLLKNKSDISDYLEKLLTERKEYYEQANFILQTEDISLTTFDKIISSCINRH